MTGMAENRARRCVISTWRGTGRYHLPAMAPLPPNEDALREVAKLAAELEAIAKRLGIPVDGGMDEAHRLQRKGYVPRITQCTRLANANAAICRARELAEGAISFESMPYRLNTARRLVDEARVAIMRAKEQQ